MLTIILNKYLNLALKLEIKMETFILCLFVNFVFIWRRGAAFGLARKGSVFEPKRARYLKLEM